MKANPFEALGLPERPDLTDEQVRAAWRQIAAATHPDRADGGDLTRYTAASAAYAELRTPWGRSEAYADLDPMAERAGFDGEPVTSPLPAVPGAPPPPGPPWQPLFALAQLPARIRRGRPRRLLVRAAVAAVLSLAVLQLIPGQPAALADVGGLILWFLLTGRKDLAPPPER
jgi:curved DNA-binding protein CbpA